MSNPIIADLQNLYRLIVSDLKELNSGFRQAVGEGEDNVIRFPAKDVGEWNIHAKNFISEYNVKRKNHINEYRKIRMKHGANNVAAAASQYHGQLVSLIKEIKEQIKETQNHAHSFLKYPDIDQADQSLVKIMGLIADITFTEYLSPGFMTEHCDDFGMPFDVDQLLNDLE